MVALSRMPITNQLFALQIVRYKRIRLPLWDLPTCRICPRTFTGLTACLTCHDRRCSRSPHFQGRVTVTITLLDNASTCICTQETKYPVRLYSRTPTPLKLHNQTRYQEVRIYRANRSSGLQHSIYQDRFDIFLRPAKNDEGHCHGIESR